MKAPRVILTPSSRTGVYPTGEYTYTISQFIVNATYAVQLVKRQPNTLMLRVLNVATKELLAQSTDVTISHYPVQIMWGLTDKPLTPKLQVGENIQSLPWLSGAKPDAAERINLITGAKYLEQDNFKGAGKRNNVTALGLSEFNDPKFISGCCLPRGVTAPPPFPPDNIAALTKLPECWQGVGAGYVGIYSDSYFISARVM